MTNNTEKQVPANACTFRCGQFEFAETEAGAKTFPFKMRARSGDVISHWYWGRVVHDMSGMILRKPTCPIDYEHSSYQIIGVGEKFTTDNDGLTVTGQLVALDADSSDKAYEVATKAKNKIPYEASIDWRGPGILIEEVGEGASAQVNGETVQGPVTIVRKWPLRSVAVTPYGQDSDTKTEFSEKQNEDMVSVCTFTATGENPVSTQATSPAASAPAQQLSDKPSSQAVSLETIKQFNDAFGPQANTFLLSGLTFDQAEKKFQAEKIAALETENKQLKEASTVAAAAAAKATTETQQLAEKVLGHPGAITTDPAAGAGGKKTFADLVKLPSKS